MEKSRGIGFSGVFHVFSVQKPQSQHTPPPFEPHPPSPPPRPVSFIHSHTFCAVHAFIHPSTHPSIALSFYHSLPLSIRSGTTSSLVEFQPFFLAFFHLLYLYFIVLSVSVLLFVRSPPRPRPPSKDLIKKERHEKSPAPPPQKMTIFSQMTTSIWDLMDKALGALCFFVYMCLNV